MNKNIALGVTFCISFFVGELQAQNLRALWHLDEGGGTTFSDSSGNGNTGCFQSIVNVLGSPCFGTLTKTGLDNPTWTSAAAAKFGHSALSMDADDVGFVPSSASLSPTTAITVEAWIKVDSYTGTDAVVLSKRNFGSDATSSYVLKLIASGGSYVPNFFIIDSTGGHILHGASGGVVIPGSGKWHHIAGLYDGATVAVWLDGILAGSAGFAGSINVTATPVLIGATSPSAPAFLFPGEIDEIRVWGRALSLVEIRTSAQNALHGLWHLDTLTSGTTPDSSGYNNTGTFSSGATADSPLVASTWTPASFGNALAFDGEDKVSIAHSPELNFHGAISISLYVATDASFSATTAQKILGKVATCTGTPGYEISQNAAGKLVFTSGGTSLTGSAGLTASGKFHIAVVVNGDPGPADLYLNGVDIASSASFTFGANSSAALQIGNSGGCTTSTVPTGLNHATIDEVSIYGSALTAGEVVFLSGTTAAGSANEAGDLSRAPLKLPGTIGQELGTGVVGPTDWNFGGTSPAMALGFWVPIDPGTALTSITLKEHGAKESTPNGSCGDVYGSVQAYSGLRALITATNNDGCGTPAHTVHFEGNIFLGGDIGLNIHWP